MLDWIRLQDQFDALAPRRSRSQSSGPALCQQEQNGWTNESGRNQSFSNGGCIPLPTPRLDVTGR